MELYLHIPFCVRKCAYCDFLSAPADAYTRKEYMNMLERQLITEAASFDGEISSVFIGGGTPSVLEAEQLQHLLGVIRSNFQIISNAEITIEANPGTITKKKADVIASSGINRVSLGLQSANDEELRLLGRIHTYHDFLQSYELLRERGIRNINVDLMSALPGQTIASYEKTLHQVLSLHPEHISAYSLIIEEGTAFYEQYREDEKLRDAGKEPQLLPSEESERAMYELTGALLSDYGYQRYEISNYAKPGFACRHNIGYWTGEEYLGIGLGASSYIKGTRFCITSDLAEYLKGDFTPREEQKLSKRDRMAEFFYLGLRMTSGVAKAEFVKRFGLSAEAVYGDVLRTLVAQQLLEDTGTSYRLTPFGRDVSNQVLYRFL
ncbi:MAG: radical SAM family heme chaperone HemW [Lachnospiraceae bacterium]|nr:radical SAM family heme chaperone HemW [Lachnospiraceae bacterium]